MAGIDPNITDNIGFTALMNAALEGHTDIVKTLLSAGADPNIKNNYGNSALILAVSKGLADMVKILLNAGADPNIQDNIGLTPLTIAIRRGNIKIVKLLLNHKNTNIYIQDKLGYSALYFAEQSRNKEIIDLINEHLAKMGNPTKIGKPITKSKSDEEEYLNKLKVANPYVILGVKHGASRTEIKEAFNNLARIWHPDRNPSPLAGEIFDLIYKAFMNLKS